MHFTDTHVQMFVKNFVNVDIDSNVFTDISDLADALAGVLYTGAVQSMCRQDVGQENDGFGKRERILHDKDDSTVLWRGVD